MSVESKVPAIRFEGFGGEWEEMELRKIAEFNPKADLPNIFEYVDLESVSGTEMISHRTESKTSAPSRAQRLARHGDVFYQTVRPYQKNNYLFDKKDMNYVFSTGYAQMRPCGDSHFLLSLVQNVEFVRTVLDNCTGTSYPAINSTDLSNIQRHTPSRKEQAKIGNYFKRLDTLIAQHQQKHDKLLNLKKALLGKMFPKQGVTVPEIRFKGFSGEWEEREVNEMFEVTRGNVLAATETVEKQTTEMPYPVYSSQTKHNGLMGYYKEFIFENAITWTTDGANAGTVNYREGKFYSTNVNGVLLSDKGYANKAIAEILNLVAWKHVSHVGNPKLMNNVMSKIKISTPSDIEEQKTIAGLLDNFDRLLNKHQAQLKKLNNIKQACLEKMFV